MTLQPKLKYNLTKLLASLIKSRPLSETMCAQAGLNTTEIQFSDIGMVNWDHIISAAEGVDMLHDLLARIKDDFQDNKDLTSLIDEIESGVDTRIVRIAKAIKTRQCILFLGPEVLRMNDGNQMIPFNKLVSQRLAEDLKAKSIYYDIDQIKSLAYISERYEDMPTFVTGEVGSKARDFYVQRGSLLYDNIYDKLAKLSFPLIINTNPDDILLRKLKESGIDAKSFSYDITNSDKIESPEITSNQSLIYNIFGSFDNPFSILFNEADNVLFTTKVIKKDPEIPNKIIKMLENKYYLFVGFDFEEWRLKILINILNLARLEHRCFALSDIKSILKESNKEYFEKEYKFYFIANSVELFLDKLIIKYNDPQLI